jgi:FkbM family methyltransferase
MKILYGVIEHSIDVTEICNNVLKCNNIIIIPSGDLNRCKIFTDPLVNVLKKIFIVNDNGVMDEYNYEMKITIDTIKNTVTSINVKLEQEIVDNKLSNIHKQLSIKHGSLNNEIPEQKMVVRYLTGSEKVLELGSNIGRNTLIIAHILGDNCRNFVSLESDKNIANQLRENRQLNNMSFHIESAALSKRKLIQKDWNTIESDIVLDGYTPVDTITLEELNAKYNIDFDTLVLDCEGAFYYILMDMPEILKNIKLIIMENDYTDMSQKLYIDTILKQNNFYVDYREYGGWYTLPCTDNFFEVWKRY